MATDVRRLYFEHCDLKAEVLAGEFLDDGVLLDNITIRPVGTFKRTFSPDIIRAELIDSDGSALAELEIDVCREGVYDMLPEGLFHQPDPERTSFNIPDLVENIRETKKEEEDARRFFLAIEKELYRTRIRIEYFERRGIDSLVGLGTSGSSGIYERELYLRIWPELAGIEQEYRSAIIQILPRAFQIAGNQELTTYVMEKVLGETVRISSTSSSYIELPEADQSKLGDCFLGYDAFAGVVCYSDSPNVEVRIGPLHQHVLKDFTAEGKAKKVCDLLIKHLFPAECEVAVIPLLKLEVQSLILNPGPDAPVLGMTSRI